MFSKLKKFGITLATLMILAFLANVIVDNPYSHQALRRLVAGELAAKSNLAVDFKAIKISAVPPGIDIYGLELVPEQSPHEPLLTASHVKARVSVWSLIIGKFTLSALDADDLALNWPPPWNFPGFLKEFGPPAPPAPPTWPPTFDLPIERIGLKNAKIFLAQPIYELPARPRELTVSIIGLDADLIWHSWNDVLATVSAKSIDLALGSSSLLEDTSLDAQLALSGQRLDAVSLRLAGPRLQYAGSGSATMQVGLPVRVISSVSVRTKGAVKGDLSVLGSFLDLADTHGAVAGDVDVQLGVPVAATSPLTFAVQGKGKVSDARFYGFRLFDSEASFAVNNREVRLPAVKVIIAGEQVAQAAGVIKLDDQLSIDFSARPQRTRLVDVLDSLNVDFNAMDAALTSSNLHLRGTGMPLHLEVSAQAKVDDLVIPALAPPDRRLPSPECNVDFHLQVTEAWLDFGGTRGHCSQPGAAPPFAKAAAASPFEVTGKVHIAATPAPAPEPPLAQAKKPPPKHTAVAAVDPVNISVRASALDLGLGRFFARIPMAGSGSAETSIRGPFDNLQVVSKFSARDVEIAHMPLGQVGGEVAVNLQTLVVSWPRIIMTPPGGGQVEASAGTLETLAADYPIKTTLAAHNVTSAAVRGIVEGLTAGDAPKPGAQGVDFGVFIHDLDGSFTGPLLKPLAGHGRVRFDLEGGDLDEETLFDRATGEITAAPSGWSSKGVMFNLGGLALKVAFDHQRVNTAAHGAASPPASMAALLATLGLAGDDRIAVEFKSLPRLAKGGATEVGDDLSRLPFVGAILRQAEIGGQIDGQGKMSGTMRGMQGSFTAALRRPTIMGAKMAAFNVRGFIHDTRIDLVMDQGASSCEGRLSLDLGKDGVPYEWYINFNRFDLRALGTTYFHADPRNYLYLTADWHLQGRFANWWHSHGELNLKDLRVKYVRDSGGRLKAVQAQLDEPVKMLFADNGWSFADGRSPSLSGQEIQLQLTLLGSRPPERLGLHAESIIDVSVLRELSSDIDTAEGKLRVLAEALGPVSNPRPRVEVTDLKPNPMIATSWKPVSLGLADMRPALRNVRMRLIYENDRLLIDKLAADKGSGTVNGAGVFYLTPSVADDSRIELSFNDATIIYPVAVLKSFETQINGNIVFSGKAFPYKLTGDIVIAKARSTREMDIRDEIINALRQKSFSTAMVAEKPHLLLDVNVTADQSINIHNRNLQMLLSTDLHVKGTDIAPLVSGQVDVDKGRFIYKRDFKIVRGIVTFDNPVKPDPSLDVLAVSEVDTYKIYVAVSGHASNPNVEFSVDPPTRESGSPISELEILVLLSRGKLPEDNHSLGLETSSALASETANLFLGQFEEPVEKLLGASGQGLVRNVYIDSHPSPDDGRPMPRLNLPIDLGEDFDVIIRRDVSANQAEVSLEYNLNENINLSGVKDFGSPGDSTANGNAAPVSSTSQLPQAPVEGDAKVNLKFKFSFE